MNNINLFAYTDELNQFLNEARLKNINFNDDDNVTLRERGVARGVYKDDSTSSGSIDGETSTMNVDFNTPSQQTKQNTNNTPSQEQPQGNPQEQAQAEPQAKPQGEPQEQPQEQSPENPQDQSQEQQIEDNSTELEKLQISYKKIINLQKKFAAFKKQCENSELTVEDVIKSAQSAGQESAPASNQDSAPTSGQNPVPSTNG